MRLALADPGPIAAGGTATIAIPAHFRGDYELRVVASHRALPPDFDTPCGLLFTAHHGRLPIEVTGT